MKVLEREVPQTAPQYSETKAISRPLASRPRPLAIRFRPLVIGLGLLVWLMSALSVVWLLHIAIAHPSLGAICRFAVGGTGVLVFAHCLHRRWQEDI